MERTREFKQMVDEDIKKCEEYIKNPQKDINLLFKLDGRYSKSSANYPSVKTNSTLLQNNKVWIDTGIIAIYGFLTAFKNNNYSDYSLLESNPKVVVTQTNTNENQISFRWLFP